MTTQLTLPDGLTLDELERAARNTNHRRAEVWTEDVCLALLAAVRRADERVREEREVLKAEIIRARDMAHVVARDSNAKLADAARRMQERCAKVADEWAAFCRGGRVVQGDLTRNFYGGGLEASEKIATAIRSLMPAATEPETAKEGM